MSLDWLAANRAALAGSGVLRPVLRTELIEKALAEAAIPTPQGTELEPLLQRFWQHQQVTAGQQRDLWQAQRI